MPQPLRCPTRTPPRCHGRRALGTLIPLAGITTLLALSTLAGPRAPASNARATPAPDDPFGYELTFRQALQRLGHPAPD